MFRKPDRKETQYTAPDHRPMIPELRQPGDRVDTVVREVRRRYDELNPTEYKNWRCPHGPVR